MTKDGARFERERRTIEAMIAIYCGGLHGRRRGLCDRCAGLLDYAAKRLDRCLFPDNKPTCAACPVHCYRPDMRAEVKDVMRYAGPRMILRHPWLAIRHSLDSRNKGPFVRRAPSASVPAADAPASGGECCAAAPDGDVARAVPPRPRD